MYSLGKHQYAINEAYSVFRQTIYYNKVYSVDKSYSKLMCPMTLYSPKSLIEENLVLKISTLKYSSSVEYLFLYQIFCFIVFIGATTMVCNKATFHRLE